FTDGLTGYHWLVLAVACGGWLFDTMDQWLDVAARQEAMAELLNVAPDHPDVKDWVGFATTWMIIGWGVGGLFFGVIGDRIGRTWTMALTILMYAGFTGMSGLAQSPEQLTLFRFLTGLGIGGEFAAGASLVAETFPAHARATALGIVQATSAIGNVMAGLIWRLFADDLGWRGVFYIGVLPALLLFVILAFIKEPQAWRDSRAQSKASGIRLGSFTELFTNPVLRRNSLVGLTLAAVGVVGFWGIGVWSSELVRGIVNPENLPELKIAANNAVGNIIMIQNGGAFFGALMFAWMAQRFGRKPAFVVALLSCAVVVPGAFWISHTITVAYVMFGLLGFALLTLFGGYAVYFPELYPTRLRATGTGFCYNVARFLAAAAPWALGSLAVQVGFKNAVLIVSSVFLLGLLVMPFAPETKDKPLPE
ncbi:MAG: MFS transporter, partial [FCB group bacterium]|nr:MFS transporter [FCB group bacterium]